MIDLREKVMPLHTTLLVVDVQNDFCSPQGALARLEADLTMIQEMIPRLARFIKEAHQAGVRVIYIQHVNSQETTSPPLLEKRTSLGRERVKVCWQGSWGAELYGGLVVEPGALVVQKHRYSAFVNTPLDLILRSQGVRTLILTGLSTNVCVESTARDGFMRDYYVVLPEDCLATTIPELHRPSLETLRRYFATVTTSHDIIAAWIGQEVRSGPGVDNL